MTRQEELHSAQNLPERNEVQNPIGNYSEKHLALILGGGIFAALFFEFLGRGLFRIFEAPYGITGTLTLVALGVWGGVSFFVIRRLRSSRLVITLVTVGACGIVLSQMVSLLIHLDTPGFLHLRTDYSLLDLLLEEGSFLAGLTAFFAGFYVSIFETHKANSVSELKCCELMAETEERRRAQENLERSEQTLHTLVSTNPESLILVDAACRILIANEVAAQRLGSSIAELAGKDLFAYCPRGSAPAFRRFFQDAAEKASLCRFEQQRGGRIFDCYISPIHKKETQVQRYAIMEIDITERKCMEENLRSLNNSLEQRVRQRTEDLRKANERLMDAMNLNQKLITLSPAGILVFKASGACVLVNDAMRRLIEVTTDDMLQADYHGMPCLRGTGLLEIIDRVSTGGKPDCGEMHIATVSGNNVWVDYHAITFLSSGEKYVLLLVNDISEKIKARHTIEEQRQSIEHAARMSVLGMMASSIAHEIKAPLAVISAGAQQLEWISRSEHMEQETLRKTGDIVLRNVNRMNDMLGSLRNLSRESGSEPVRHVSIKSVIDIAVEACGFRLQTGGAVVEISAIADISFECRLNQLAQALSNLLINASEAVETSSEKWIRLEAWEEGEHVRFAVTDSGTHLKRETREDMFIPFFTTKPAGKGVGLGLNISKRIVEGHGGHLELDDSFPHTRFIMSIPKTHVVLQPVENPVSAPLSF